MAIVNRISRLFKADFHAVLDQIEEPEQLLKQAIRDMEDDLARTEQSINAAMLDRDAMRIRTAELEQSVIEIDAQLDLCFASGKNDLARSQIRKKLEAQRLLKRLTTKQSATEKYHDEQRALLESNRATLESLQQKAELFAQRRPVRTDSESEFNDITWMARDLSVDEDEIEIAFLREQDARKGS